MTDIVLAWFVGSSRQPQVSRTQVTQWCADQGMPVGTMSRLSMVAVFRRVSEAAGHTYTCEGVEHTLDLREVARQIPGTMIRDVFSQGPPGTAALKVAQVKLLLTLKNAQGPVPDSHSLTFRVRPDLAPAHEVAAREFFAGLLATFEARQELVSMDVVGRIVRAAIDEAGVPCRGRFSMHYVYADNLHMVERLGRFLDLLGTGGEVFTAHLRDHPRERRLVAEAADDHLLGLAIVHELRVEQAKGSRPLMGMRARIEILQATQDRLAAQVLLHVDRLGLPLPRSAQVLAECESKISSLEPHGSLPNVNDR